MKIQNHYQKKNKRFALTNINQLVRNIFSNCHQLPTWRNTPNGTTLVPMRTLISNLSSAYKTDVKPPTTNTSKQNDSQLKLSFLSLTLVISQSLLSDKDRTPSTGNTRDRDRSDQKKSSGESPYMYPTHFPNHHFPIPPDRNRKHLSPPVKEVSPAFLKRNLDPDQIAIFQTLTTAQKNRIRPLSVSHTPNPFSSPPVAKITIDLLSVSHTFNPLLSPLTKITTYPLSVSHTLNPFSSPPVSAKEHVSVTPNSVKTIKPFNPHAAVVAVAATAAVPVYRTRRCEPRLEHHYFSLYLTQFIDLTEPPNIRPRHIYDPNLAPLAPLKHSLLIFRMDRTRHCEPRLEQHYFTLYLTLSTVSKNRVECDYFCKNYGSSFDLHSAPPKHGILILNG